MSKSHYSYFLVKPDGIRFLDDLCQIVESRFGNVRYYAVEDFEATIKKLYHKHYETKGKKFSDSFDAYLYGLRELFGNETVLMLVSDSDKSYEELMQGVFNTKNEIRQKYVNNKVGIVTNHGNENESFIRFLSQTGVEKKPRIMNELGNYRISDLNTIHSPDPSFEDTITELQILASAGIIDDKNLITKSMLDNMRRYRTSSFQEDMKKPGYEGEIKPDISGFIRRELDDFDDGNR